MNGSIGPECHHSLVVSQLLNMNHHYLGLTPMQHVMKGSWIVLWKNAESVENLGGFGGGYNNVTPD
jgi:hypothetical protein